MNDESLRMLGRMEGKLDTVLERLEKHEQQISALEKVKTQALTIVGFVTFTATLGWDWVKHKLGIS